VCGFDICDGYVVVRISASGVQIQAEGRGIDRLLSEVEDQWGWKGRFGYSGN
jgi:hypothetical protein